MLLDPHEHNLALYLSAAGERARADGGALPDRGFADTLRTRLLAQAAEPLPRQPRKPREPRRPWTLPTFLRLPRPRRLLPIAVAAVLLLGGIAAAHELYLAIGSLASPGSAATLTDASPTAAPSDSAAGSATESLEPASGEPSSGATPEGTAPVGSGPTPRPTPRPSGAPTSTPRPSGAPSSPPTPGPTAPPTPVPTAVPTAVPTPSPTPSPTVPDAPFLLSAVGTLPGEIQLDWLPPADDGGDAISEYRVCQSVTQGVGYVCSVTGSTLTVATVSGLTTGMEYWFRIQAVNSIGNSLMSNERSDVAP